VDAATDRTPPSFAMRAAALVREGRSTDAVHLCADGIRLWPDYITGYLLLADAYAALGHATDAEVILAEAARRFPYYRGIARERVQEVVQERVQEVVQERVQEEVQEVVQEEVQEVVQERAQEVVQKPVVPVTPRAASSPISLLRIVHTAQQPDDVRQIRSSSVRLIPGLEYTSLRFENTRGRGRREISMLPEPPVFREFHPTQRPRRTDGAAPQRRPLSLEELAARLEQARIPRTTDAPSTPTPAPNAAPQATSAIMTETLAKIYVSQGAYEIAIEAYRTLQRTKPERSDDYQRIIDDLQRKLDA
jgi:tetratricopeptide (TPR) repeat protein